MRVLLLEDNQDLLDMTGLVLRSAAHEVLPARSVDEGLRLLALSAADPGLAIQGVVLDLYMPGLDGWWLLDHLPAGVPVVVTTGAAAHDLGRVADRPNTVILRKPFDPSALLAALDALERKEG